MFQTGRMCFLVFGTNPMLKTWLKPLVLADFSTEYLRKQPLAQPSTAKATVPLFTWESLDRVLRREPDDVLVVAGGKLIDVPAPRTLAELSLLMKKRGIGIVLRKAEREDPALDELALAFAQDLGGEAHIQLFVTKGSTHGFGWHYDREDVFIAQTCGTKDYFFRENTITQTCCTMP